MKRIVFATGNGGKLREASEILGGGFELVSPAQMGINDDVPETGLTLKANSIIKAEHIWNSCSCDCFADDTGLEVDVLGGEPGVHTARYAGEEKDFNRNMDKLLSELDRLRAECSMAEAVGVRMNRYSRRARFRSVVTLILDGRKYFFEGVLEGTIAYSKSGSGGFGYDPVFIPDEYPGKTLADISEEEKNAISHRGKALRAMAAFLSTRMQ